MIIPTARVEFLSDGIIAIAITMMVVEIRIPEAGEMAAATQWAIFFDSLPLLLIYMFSYVMLAIVWMAHHNLYDFIKHIDMKLLWLNMHLLFWLTMIPIATYFIGRYPALPITVAGYGFTMLMMSLAFSLSRRYALAHRLLVICKSPEVCDDAYRITKLKQERSYPAITIYALSVCFSFIYIPLAYACFAIPALFYFLPYNVKNQKLAKFVADMFKRKKDAGRELGM